jgi:lia operon protein LiaG
MWFYFGINISKTVKVYIPSGVTGSLTVMLSSGNVNTMEGLELDLESISINLSSGNADLKDITAENTNIDISSGDAELDGFETGAINADLSSGDLSISNSTISGGIDVNISSGHLTITNTSADVLTTDVSSGNVTAEGFTVNSVSTNSSSGDVELHLTGAPEDYSIDIDVSSGDILLDGGGVHMSTNSDLTWGTGSKHIDCDTSSGDVKIYFSDNN